MITATTRDLREHCNRLLNSVAKGEDVLIKRNGRTVARLTPEEDDIVDWTKSAAFRRDRTGWPTLTAAQIIDAVHESSSKW